MPYRSRRYRPDKIAEFYRRTEPDRNRRSCRWSIRPTSHASVTVYALMCLHASLMMCAGIAVRPDLHNITTPVFREGNDTVFDPARALKFTYFSSAAYCSLDSIASWSCKPCLMADPSFSPKAFWSPRTGMQAFVGMAAEGIIVAFRGSDNLENWIENLQFSKRSVYPKCAGCEVHSGFYETWLSVSDGVISEVMRLHALHPKSKIFLTGHSLGAAVAALCAAELGASSHSLGLPIAAVYNYGQPRVGNAAFASFYETGTHVSWRVTHWRDPVPHLPLEFMGFHHLTTEVFYNQDSSSFQVCDSSGEDPTCSNRFGIIANDISDHLHYLDPPVGEIGVCS
ncbi:hypothetical protein AB1Y20_021134 [Prymnesium parvum]|uniref:Fungal lipase-type domain-containing protein n=1 Tax=Prymnesium parvum TaxID=97485 RepID=A0AB34JJI7_PRYPA